MRIVFFMLRLEFSCDLLSSLRVVFALRWEGDESLVLKEKSDSLSLSGWTKLIYVWQVDLLCYVETSDRDRSKSPC